MGWNVNSVKLLEQTKLPAFPLVSYCQNLESLADATISNVLTQWIRNTTHFTTVFETKLWWHQKITSQYGQCAIHHEISLFCFWIAGMEARPSWISMYVGISINVNWAYLKKDEELLNWMLGTPFLIIEVLWIPMVCLGKRWLTRHLFTSIYLLFDRLTNQLLVFFL